MNEHLINDILDGYKRLGGCGDIYRELAKCKTADDLVQVYLTHPTWCMELGFPTLDDIRENFADQQRNGIFVDCTFNGEVFSEKQVYVFHNCKGLINVAMDYDNAVIPMLYFCNGCQLHVECNQSNPLPIQVPMWIYDNSMVTVNGRGNAVFTRNDGK